MAYTCPYCQGTTYALWSEIEDGVQATDADHERAHNADCLGFQSARAEKAEAELAARDADNLALAKRAEDAQQKNSILRGENARLRDACNRVLRLLEYYQSDGGLAARLSAMMRAALEPKP